MASFPKGRHYLLLAVLTCDPAMTRLFTPLHPQLGRYEVCTDPRPLSEVVVARGGSGPESFHESAVEELEPLDAFGGAGTYDRFALARLYGGRRVKVVRGWRRADDRFESETLLSPYPNASLDRLEPGTMIVRWITSRP